MQLHTGEEVLRTHSLEKVDRRRGSEARKSADAQERRSEKRAGNRFTENKFFGSGRLFGSFFSARAKL